MMKFGKIRYVSFCQLLQNDFTVAQPRLHGIINLTKNADSTHQTTYLINQVYWCEGLNR